MKKYIYILLAVILVSGCSNDILKKDPLDETAPQDLLNSKEAFRSALDGVYATMKSEFTGYTMSYVTVPEAASDNLIATNEGFTFDGVDTEIYPLNYSASAFELEGLWRLSYEAIKNTNTIIKQARSQSGTDFEPYLGEALALRAFLHYSLYRFFAPAYNYDKEAASVPYRYADDNLEEEPTRISNEELIQNVIADLNEAESLADNENNSYRISLTAIRGLLARVYLETEQYSLAAEYAEKALNDDRYHLENTVEGLKNEWYFDESDEIIYRLRIEESDQTATNSPMFGSEVFFSYPFKVPEELLDLYDQQNDIRFPVYFAVNPTHPDEYYPKKYEGQRGADPQTGAPGVTDVKFLRVPQLYLIAAEAYARQSENGQAEEKLNDLRESRGLSDYDSASDGSLLEAILTERRRELVFEGLRFTDLKRLGEGFTREDGTQMSPNDNRYAFPIPLSEIERSGMDQNPGY